MSNISITDIDFNKDNLSFTISGDNDYGLDKSKLEQVLKNTEINRKNNYFFLYPILDTHTQSLELHDNVNICYEWIHYKNFYEILQSSSKGTLQTLNDDVITIICQFLYNPYYNCYV